MKANSNEFVNLRSCKYVRKEIHVIPFIGGNDLIPYYICTLVENGKISVDETNGRFCQALHMGELTEEIYKHDKCKYYKPREE